MIYIYIYLFIYNVKYCRESSFLNFSWKPEATRNIACPTFLPSSGRTCSMSFSWLFNTCFSVIRTWPGMRKVSKNSNVRILNTSWNVGWHIMISTLIYWLYYIQWYTLHTVYPRCVSIWLCFNMVASTFRYQDIKSLVWRQFIVCSRACRNTPCAAVHQIHHSLGFLLRMSCGIVAVCCNKRGRQCKFRSAKTTHQNMGLSENRVYSQL